MIVSNAVYRRQLSLLTGFWAVVCVALMAISAPVAAQVAGEETDKYANADSHIRKLIISSIKRTSAQVGRYGTDNPLASKLVLPPLPGEQAAADTNEDGDIFYKDAKAELTSYGPQETKDLQVLLPPLTGFRQYSNTKVMQEMLKELVTKKIPVMAQTMYMVENGAATGYFNGLNFVNNIMQTTLQTQDFQFQLFDATDRTGRMKYSYVNELFENVKEHKNWPGGLHANVGDQGKNKGGDDDKWEKIEEDKAFSLKGIPRGANDKSLNNKDADKKEAKFSEILFGRDGEGEGSGSGGPAGPAGADAKFKNKELDKVRKDFVNFVGDYKFKLEENKDNKAIRELKVERVAPKEDDKKRYGLAKETWEGVGAVWEGLFAVLGGYCEFKQENPNKSIKVKDWKKDTGGTTDKIKKEMWEGAQAPDIPITTDLINQLFTLVVAKSSNEKKLECSELKNMTKSYIPEKLDQGKGENLDDCGKEAGCIRNRLILYMSFIIARSRALHSYRELYTISKRFALDPASSAFVDKIFTDTLANMDVDDAIVENRVKWFELVEFMSKLAQSNSGAGGMFRGSGGGGLTDGVASSDGHAKD